MSDIEQQIETMARQARAAALRLSQLTTEQKNGILLAMAKGLRDASPVILESNAKDLAAGESKGLTLAMLDRLRLDEARIDAIAGEIDQMGVLPDPVGDIMAS